MHASTRSKLLALNRHFYEITGSSFSRSRYKIQPGVRNLLPQLLAFEKLLDLGCGNGNLAQSLANRGFTGIYQGLDQSTALLQAAKALELPASQYSFTRFDLAAWLLEEEQQFSLSSQNWPAITCFATLHHLPSQELQAAFFKRLKAILAPGGQLFISVWQPSQSPRLSARFQDWSSIDLSPQDLDAGDRLLDWRSNEQDSTALRYVHEFSPEELTALGMQAGLTLVESYRSDGRKENLGYYQVWQA